MANRTRPNLISILKLLIPVAAIAAAGYLAWVSPGFTPTRERQEQILAQADKALLEGRLDTAAESFERIARIAPENSRASFGLGLVRMRQERYVEALAAFDTAVRLEPDNGDFGYPRARTLQLLGRRDEAIAALTALHETDPRRFDVETDRIALLIDAQRWSEAEIAGTDALSRTLDQYKLRLQAGRIAGHSGNHSKAIEHYEMARLIRPYAPQPVYGLIEQYRAGDRIDDARKLMPVFEALRARAAEIEKLRTTARAAPSDPSPSIQYLERLFEEGWLDEAIEQTNIFLNLHAGLSGNRGILLKAASASAEMGDTEGALRFLELVGTDGLDDRESLAVADVLVDIGELPRARAIDEEEIEQCTAGPGGADGDRSDGAQVQ